MHLILSLILRKMNESIYYLFPQNAKDAKQHLHLMPGEQSFHFHFFYTTEGICSCLREKKYMHKFSPYQSNFHFLYHSSLIQMFGGEVKKPQA